MADINTIIVGVDGSDSSREALRFAYDEAAHHGATVMVVSTWHYPALPLTRPQSPPPSEGYASQPQQDALNQLEQFVATLDQREPAVDVRTSVEEGNPVEVLIERSKKADLLVVGSRGLGGFKGLLLGSVSHHLVAHAECPVVVVR